MSDLTNTQIRTKEIPEAAVFYLNGLKMVKYSEKYWLFQDADNKGQKLRMQLINQEISVEPLDFMDAIRRVKSFSNS